MQVLAPLPDARRPVLSAARSVFLHGDGADEPAVMRTGRHLRALCGGSSKRCCRRSGVRMAAALRLRRDAMQSVAGRDHCAGRTRAMNAHPERTPRAHTPSAHPERTPHTPNAHPERTPRTHAPSACPERMPRTHAPERTPRTHAPNARPTHAQRTPNARPTHAQRTPERAARTRSPNAQPERTSATNAPAPRERRRGTVAFVSPPCPRTRPSALRRRTSSSASWPRPHVPP